jgi:phosphate transport system protein
MAMVTGARVRAAVDRTAALGQLCCEALALTRRALETGDELTARRVVAGDAAIDRAARALEGEALAILATGAPLAGDLRRAVAVLETLGDLERVGDYAVHAARAVEGAAGAAPPELVAMAAEAEAMVEASVTALTNEDAALAQRVVARDSRVDRLCAHVRRRLEREAEAAAAAVGGGRRALTHGRWQMAARALERAADHAVAVAEWAVYAAVGERPAVGAP